MSANEGSHSSQATHQDIGLVPEFHHSFQILQSFGQFQMQKKPDKKQHVA